MPIIVVKTFTSFSNCYVVGNLTEYDLATLRRKEGWDKKALKILLALLKEKWLIEYDQEFTMHAVTLLNHLTRFGYRIVASVGTISTSGTQFCWVMTRPGGPGEESITAPTPPKETIQEETVIIRVLGCTHGTLRLPRPNDVLLGFYQIGSKVKGKRKKKKKKIQLFKKTVIQDIKESLKLQCRRLPSGELECLVHNIQGPLKISAVLATPPQDSIEDDVQITFPTPVRCVFKNFWCNWRTIFCKGPKKKPKWGPQKQFAEALIKDYLRRGRITFDENLSSAPDFVEEVNRLESPQSPKKAKTKEEIQEIFKQKMEEKKAIQNEKWEHTLQLKKINDELDKTKSKKKKMKTLKRPGYHRKKTQTMPFYPRVEEKPKNSVVKKMLDQYANMVPPDICAGRRKWRKKSKVKMDNRQQIAAKELKSLKYSINVPKLRSNFGRKPSYWDHMYREKTFKPNYKAKKKSKKSLDIKKLETNVSSWLTMMEYQGIESEGCSWDRSEEEVESEAHSWLDSVQKYGDSDDSCTTLFESSDEDFQHPKSTSIPDGPIYLISSSSMSPDERYQFPDKWAQGDSAFVGPAQPSSEDSSYFSNKCYERLKDHSKRPILLYKASRWGLAKPYDRATTELILHQLRDSWSSQQDSGSNLSMTSCNQPQGLEYPERSNNDQSREYKVYPSYGKTSHTGGYWFTEKNDIKAHGLRYHHKEESDSFSKDGYGCSHGHRFPVMETHEHARSHICKHGIHLKGSHQHTYGTARRCTHFHGHEKFSESDSD